MATSPRMRWPYPSEGADPWYDAFEDFVGAQDASDYALEEAKNIIVTGGGTFTWSATTNLLSWTGIIQLNSANSGFLENIPASLAGVSVPNDGDLGYVSFISAPQSNVTLTLSVGATLPPADIDLTFVLFRRKGDRIFFRNGAVLLDGESAAVIDDGPGAGADLVTYKIRGSTAGVTNTLNFVGPVPVSGSSGGGETDIEFQLAADSTRVTVTPYALDTDYRAFYVDRGTPTTFNLAPAASLAGQYVLVKTLTGNAVAIVAFAGDTVEGAGSISLAAQYESVLLHSATIDGGLTYNWYIASKNGVAAGGGNPTFSLSTVEVISTGNMVAVDGSGNAVVADSTVVGRYPALGICVSVVGATITIQPTGATTLLAGMTPGLTYYLGTTGGIGTTPPMGALVSQAVVQAYSATSGVLLTSSPVVYT